MRKSNFPMIQTKSHKELEDVLLEPKEKGVKEPYFVIRGDKQNITVLSPGLNGHEYNKTYGHFHNYLGIEIYNCLYGQGILIMQRNNEEGDAKEFKVVTLHPGKQVEIPSGFGHSLINIGKNYLVVLDNAPNTPKSHNYESVKEKRGFAYYIVEKKGEIALELNSNYRVHPQISSE
jgi:oxalate decarboxylase/phosphoglucose isomerase-like protein (cupin superfamily)